MTGGSGADLLAFLGGLTCTQGEGVGDPLHVFPWQRRFVRGAFRPGVSSAALSVARGAGKSTLLAGVAAAAVAGPLARRRAEVVVVAPSYTQSRVIFEACREFIRELDGLPRSRYRVQDSANLASIEDRVTGARVKCLGADPSRLHGLQAWCVLVDEPSELSRNQRDRIRSALTTGLGKIPGSLFVALGTQSSDDRHWFRRMFDPGGADYVQLHAAARKDPPFQRKTWRKAMPSLDWMPSQENIIRDHAKRARKDEAELASFQALRLNLGTSDVTERLVLSADTWERAEGEAERAGPAYWGVDLSQSSAQSAVAAYWPETGRLEAVAAFPELPDLRERGLRDGVGRLYLDCWKRGELIQCGGRAVDVQALLTAALEAFGRPSGIACDSWREAELRDALAATNFPLAALELRRNGYFDGGDDLRAFRRAFLEGKAVPVVSLLMRAAMSEARVATDTAGNEKLATAGDGVGKRRRGRDDAVAAAILAVALGVRRCKPGRQSGMRYAIVG